MSKDWKSLFDSVRKNYSADLQNFIKDYKADDSTTKKINEYLPRIYKAIDKLNHDGDPNDCLDEFLLLADEMKTYASDVVEKRQGQNTLARDQIVMRIKTMAENLRKKALELRDS